MLSEKYKLKLVLGGKLYIVRSLLIVDWVGGSWLLWWFFCDVFVEVVIEKIGVEDYLNCCLFVWKLVI